MDDFWSGIPDEWIQALDGIDEPKLTKMMLEYVHTVESAWLDQRVALFQIEFGIDDYMAAYKLYMEAIEIMKNNESLKFNVWFPGY